VHDRRDSSSIARLVARSRHGPWPDHSVRPDFDISKRGVPPGVTGALWLAFAAALPLGVLLLLFVLVVWGDAEVVDFRSFYTAGTALLHGESPYPEYVYPPLTAIASVPLALLPLGLAEAIVIIGLAGGVVATLFVLDVRDWRCYGLAFLWPPVISGIQTGNITILLGLAAALAWRFRARPLSCSLSVGITLAAKFFLWPLVIWLAATRRYVTAGLSCVAGAGFLILSWAAIGFAGLGDYGSIVRRVQGVVESDSYTAYVVALDLGASPALARAVWLTLAFALLAGCIALGRRANDAGAFILAIAASLAFTPIVWLHYFALLLIVVAVAQPTLGVIWFVPLAMVITPGSGQPSAPETFATLVIASLTIALALRASLHEKADVTDTQTVLSRPSVRAS